ncbi:hypothetical protein RZS08_47195, partial [Arthrospira platensis SPKY1]|nr:hypothetical protein [Arthrospira platensis SPKY1]
MNHHHTPSRRELQKAAVGAACTLLVSMYSTGAQASPSLGFSSPLFSPSIATQSSSLLDSAINNARSLLKTNTTSASSPQTGTFVVNSQTFSSSACARENRWCNFSGQQAVAYGASGKYVVKTLSGPVHCSNK